MTLTRVRDLKKEEKKRDSQEHHIIITIMQL